MMSTNNKRKLPRQDLYDLVWQRAMRKLAPEFGMSGNGLAKLCRREGIPVPDRGYWAKLQHGKRVRRPPLPALKPGQSEYISLGEGPAGRRRLEAAMLEPLAALLQAEHGAADPIIVPHSPTLHPLVAKWQPPKKPAFGTARFTPAAEARRRHIATVLFRELERRGGSIAVDNEQLFKVTFFGETIEISFRERLQMVVISHDPHRSWGTYERREWRPTGLLRLRFENYFDVPVRREWNETEHKPLEACLRDILIGLFIALEAERQRHQRLAERERLEAEAQQRRYDLEEEQRRERERVQMLQAQAKAWEDATRIRNYVAAVVTRDEGAAQSWAQWALAIADKIDPVFTSTATRSEHQATAS